MIIFVKLVFVYHAKIQNSIYIFTISPANPVPQRSNGKKEARNVPRLFHAKPSGYLAAPVSSVAVHVLSPAAQLVGRPVMLGESTPAVTERVIA